MAHLKNSILPAALLLLAACGSATAQDWEYLDRSDGISIAGGNANAANLAIQTPTPWPSYVEDVTIPGHGEQAADLIDNFYKKHTAGEGGQAGGTTTPGQ